MLRGRPEADCGGLKVATVEDLVVLELIAVRVEVQADLAALAGRRDMDWPDVEAWADTWEVGERLRRIQALVGSE